MLCNNVNDRCNFEVIKEVAELSSSPQIFSETVKMNNQTSISPAIHKISSPNLNELSPSYKSNLQKLMSKKHTESTSVINFNPIQLRIDSIFKKYSTLKRKYNKFNIDSLKKKYRRFTFGLVFIDLFSAIADIIVVTWMYFDHFIYNKTYTTSEENNQARFISLGISIAVSLILIWRIKVKANLEEVKYLLSKRSKKPKSKFKLRFLLIEIFLHVLQPYPYLDYHWHMKVIGNPVTYSLNMILFSISMLRLYVLVKVIKYWNLFTNDNSRRIFKFFQNKLIDLFFYKANLKRYGFLCVVVIFGLLIYFGSLIFKVYENYTNTEEETFGLIWNCFWFLIQSMAAIGYGELLPNTLIGRVITVFWCIAGMFLLSLLVVILTSFITLNDLEAKAYNEINLNYSKKLKNSSVKTYLNSMIKYKFNTNRTGVNNYLMRWLKIREDFKINKEKYLLRLFASIRKQMTIADFCNNTSDLWENFYVNSIDDIEKYIYSLEPSASYFIDNLYSYTRDMKNSKSYSFRNLNLIKFMSKCGSPVEIRNISEIKSDCIMNDKDFHRQLKEFKVFNKAMAALRGSSFASSRKVYSEYEGVDYQNYDEMNNNRKARNKFFTAPSKILSQKKM